MPQGSQQGPGAVALPLPRATKPSLHAWGPGALVGTSYTQQNREGSSGGLRVRTLDSQSWAWKGFEKAEKGEGREPTKQGKGWSEGEGTAIATPLLGISAAPHW